MAIVPLRHHPLIRMCCVIYGGDLPHDDYHSTIDEATPEKSREITRNPASNAPHPRLKNRV